MKKQHRQKLTVRVTPQTAYNLERLMTMSGQKTPGRVVDKLVREKMLALRGRKHRNGGNEMKYDCMKPEWADNGALPAGNGRIGRVRGMRMWAHERETED